jgi:hypothetical protein
MKTIWTTVAYQLLYEQLVCRFGPHKDWASTHPPGYWEFCAVFAELVGANSAQAVSHQIQFALGVRGDSEHHWKSGHARNAILNMSAAFWAGFIDNSYFPSLVAKKNGVEMVVA